MAVDLKAMLRKAIFETKTRLHSLEQALKHLISSPKPVAATPARKRVRKQGRPKGIKNKAKVVASAPQAKKAPRPKPAKGSRPKRGAAAKQDAGESSAS